MTIVCLEEDQKTISKRFRKTDYFAFLDKGEVVVQKNLHKLSKSPQFFNYFKRLNVDTIYLKALGYKTFLKLNALGVKVYFVKEAETYTQIDTNELLPITEENAKAFCTLGHK
jgi:predicted Fe-Mo cluster-binding NifX family protein